MSFYWINQDLIRFFSSSALLSNFFSKFSKEKRVFLFLLIIGQLILTKMSHMLFSCTFCSNENINFWIDHIDDRSLEIATIGYLAPSIPSQRTTTNSLNRLTVAHAWMTIDKWIKQKHSVWIDLAGTVACNAFAFPSIDYFLLLAFDIHQFLHFVYLIHLNLSILSIFHLKLELLSIF